MQRPLQMHPDSFRPYINAMVKAGIDPEFAHRADGARVARIVQLIGNAPASAGYHSASGSYLLDGTWHEYCACIDIRTRDLNEQQTIAMWLAMMEQGFAGWWRHTNSFANNQHFHMADPRIPIRGSHGYQVRAQVHSYLRGNSGLAGDAPIDFLQQHLSEVWAQNTRNLFLAHNPMMGAVLQQPQASVGEPDHGDDDSIHVTGDNYAQYLPDAEADGDCCDNGEVKAGADDKPGDADPDGTPGDSTVPATDS